MIRFLTEQERDVMNLLTGTWPVVGRTVDSIMKELDSNQVNADTLIMRVRSLQGILSNMSTEAKGVLITLNKIKEGGI
jgi:hypothetical protein